ncbi:MAG: 50S ribosomal protein L31 [Fluviicoccus sp.]|uniref:50S ribosomal protein L31 n=1 Tax=Fluviicoccus sp. TaxID=2003552 RepID=UPI00272335A1|nr:50S ribosomal protein L31 [Fluviicoccus sp.]MDO8331465.1 50S ribosomal protein L31 [Fluviicoccus sp.]
MRADIHPRYEEITATCSCGNIIQTRSTLGKNIHLDVCGKCHPFYTGQQKVVDTGGRIDKFKQRFGVRGVVKK